MVAGLPQPHQLGLVLLLRGNAQDTGVANLLGTQPLEERVRAVGRGDDPAVPEGHPLALKASGYLGQTERFHRASQPPALTTCLQFTGPAVFVQRTAEMHVNE